MTHKRQKKVWSGPLNRDFFSREVSFTRLKLGNLLFSMGSGLIRGVYSQLLMTVCGFKLTDVGSVIYAWV